MDAFFVEVERLRRPELRGIPVAVGGDGPRGVVASASYEARRFGVRSAMPTGAARRACPQLVVVPADHRRYQEASEQVFAIFHRFTPLVEGVSLDEAFLDVSGLRLHYPHPVEVGEELRAVIRRELQLPASVGVASNKLLAKLASEAAKPDGLFHVPAALQLEFLHRLPVRRLWGVGEATHAALERLGVETVGDLAEVPLPTLTRAVGEAVGRHLSELAQGHDPRPVVPDSEAKSISVEHTYQTDLRTREEVEAALLGHAEKLAGRLRRAGLVARTVTVKLRFADFTTLTRSHTLPAPTDLARHLHHAATDLARRVPLTGPVRLVGLGVSGLEDGSAPRQLDLQTPPEWDRMERTVDAIRARFGEASVQPARLRPPPADGSTKHKSGEPQNSPSPYTGSQHRLGPESPQG